jgi:hypothetical protein
MNDDLEVGATARRRQSGRRARWAMWMATCGVALAGCGGEQKVEVHPVSGSVTFRGNPLPNALVVLHDSAPVADQQGRPIPRGRPTSRGSFISHPTPGPTAPRSANTR